MMGSKHFFEDENYLVLVSLSVKMCVSIESPQKYPLSKLMDSAEPIEPMPTRSLLALKESISKLLKALLFLRAHELK